MNAVKFFIEFLKDPQIGALTPSSKYFVRDVIKRMPLENAETVVEYGAGEGVVTRGMLKKMLADSKLIAIDTNSELVKNLKKINDSRLEIYHGKVQEFIVQRKEKTVDCAISGIPFTYLAPKEKEYILAHTAKILKPDGIFVVYQFNPLIGKFLKKYFKVAKEELVLSNWPLYTIFTCRPKN